MTQRQNQTSTVSLGLTSFQYSSLYIPISHRQSSDAIAALYSLPVVTLRCQLHEWRKRPDPMLTKADRKFLEFSQFLKFTKIANTLRNKRDAPPLAVRQTQTALFRKLLNINELQTHAKDRPQDFCKHAVSGNLGTVQQQGQAICINHALS